MMHYELIYKDEEDIDPTQIPLQPRSRHAQASRSEDENEALRSTIWRAWTKIPMRFFKESPVI